MSINTTYPVNFSEISDMVPHLQQLKLYFTLLSEYAVAH